MYEAEGDWKENVPADLIPAIKHLRGTFEEVHFGCGQGTRLFCYAALHNEVADDPEHGFSRYLAQVQNRISPLEAGQFTALLREGTHPSIFKAYYDLYLNGVGAQALHSFAHLVAIGRANESHLATSFLEWAEAQTKHLIRSQRHLIRIWVRNVCDKQMYDPNEDPDERIFWLKWQAPSLVIMKPSRYRPYEAEKVWERNYPDTSSQWLKSFEDDYVLRLEMKVSRVAGEAALALAKRPKATQPSPAPLSPLASKQEESVASTPTPGKPLSPTTTRREARKLETQTMYASWQKAYRRLVRTYPHKPDVWYSQKISGMSIAKGSSAETIRKHMTK